MLASTVSTLPGRPSQVVDSSITLNGRPLPAEVIDSQIRLPRFELMCECCGFKEPHHAARCPWSER